MEKDHTLIFSAFPPFLYGLIMAPSFTCPANLLSVSFVYKYIKRFTTYPSSPPLDRLHHFPSYKQKTMGVCASSQHSNASLTNWPFTAKIIHTDGRLQELRHPVKASHILNQNPNCFLCSSESMKIDSIVPQISSDRELELGEIYFLIPLKKAHLPISLTDLCSLAAKANVALASSKKAHPSLKAAPTAVGYRIGAAGTSY